MGAWITIFLREPVVPSTVFHGSKVIEMSNGNGSDFGLVVSLPGNITGERWFEEVRWGEFVNGLPGRTPGLPESIQCPHCGCCDRISECPNRKPQPYFCGACRKRFSVRTGTGLSHSPIPLEKWATGLRLDLITGGISGMELQRLLDLNYRSAWYMLQRIREGWPKQESLNCKIAAIDEAFYGEKEKWRHFDKKWGRNWLKGKVIVVVMVDVETGRVAAEVIPDRTEETLSAFVRKHLLPGGTLISDEYSSYSDFGWAERHVSVNHQKGEYVKDGAGTNGAESFNAYAKEAYRTYRHISPKYFSRYLNEIVGRYNIRGMDIQEQMKFLVSGMMRKRLTYQDLLATEVPPRPFTHHRCKEGEPFRKVRKMTNPGVCY